VSTEACFNVEQSCCTWRLLIADAVQDGVVLCGFLGWLPWISLKRENSQEAAYEI
jgi:hypothetical protein